MKKKMVVVLAILMMVSHLLHFERDVGSAWRRAEGCAPLRVGCSVAAQPARIEGWVGFAISSLKSRVIT